MKLVDVKLNTYIDSNKEIKKKDPDFKIGHIVRISKYKNIFGKSCTPNWTEEIFVIKKVKNTVLWTHVINDLNGEETFTQENCKKKIKESLEMLRLKILKIKCLILLT